MINLSVLFENLIIFYPALDVGPEINKVKRRWSSIIGTGYDSIHFEVPRLKAAPNLRGAFEGRGR